MKTFKFLFALCFTMLLFTGCKKDKDDNGGTPTTLVGTTWEAKGTETGPMPGTSDMHTYTWTDSFRFVSATTYVYNYSDSDGDSSTWSETYTYNPPRLELMFEGNLETILIQGNKFILWGDQYNRK